MARVSRFAVPGLVLIGLGLLAASCWAWVHPQASPAFRTLAPLALGNLLENTSATGQVIIHNPTEDTITILGSEVTCTIHGCLKALDLPIRIPPRGEASLGLSFAAAKPGAIDSFVTIFTDHALCPRIVLTAAGEVIQGAPAPVARVVGSVQPNG